MINQFPFVKIWIIFILILSISIVGVFVYSKRRVDVGARQATIHNMGSHVMPFDLDQTKHIFKKDENGGTEQVVVREKDNKSQIGFIQMHLKMEAVLFQQGDFSDPASLHGDNMPGLRDISKGASNIKIAYTDLPDGGEIRYYTNDSKLINAIHSWFDAQVNDHGSDASN